MRVRRNTKKIESAIMPTTVTQTKMICLFSNLRMVPPMNRSQPVS